MPGPDPTVRGDGERGSIPSVDVPEVRDYARINAELVALLDAGHPRVRLSGVDGQRLLVQGLRGVWRAVVEVRGNAGPELAAGLDSPHLTVVCFGSAADGAGRGLRSGNLLILGDAGLAAGVSQQGGTIAIAGSAGSRAGLRQAGGTLVINGAVGRLAGERQTGGCLIALDGPVGPRAGHGRRGGRFVNPPISEDVDLSALAVATSPFAEWWVPHVA